MATYQEHLVKPRPEFTWSTTPRRVILQFTHLGVHYYATATWKRHNVWDWRVGLDLARTRYLAHTTTERGPTPEALMDWAFGEVK